MKAQPLAAAVVVALSAGGAWAQSSDRTASDLTRDLNSLPSGAAIAPVSPTPTPAQSPAPTPAAVATPAASPPPAPHQPRPAAIPAPTPTPAPSSATSTLNTTTYGPAATPVSPPPAATPRPTTPAPAPTPRPTTATPAPAPRPTTPAPAATTAAPAPRPATPAPAPGATPPATAAVTPAPTPTPAPAVVALDATAISALPFRVTLPPGFLIVPGRAGPNAQIYSIKRGEETFAMIYTGASSQFPIYDGQMVQAAGRTSIVVTEDGRRTAAEHLFQRATAPEEVHVWISSLEGEDRVMAESIAQSVDVR